MPNLLLSHVHPAGPKAMRNFLRCSGKVEFMAALDMEHEVSSVEVFHHKKEVFLEEKTG